MAKQILSLMALFCLIIGLQAQDKKETDRAAIKNMCGCYEVQFDFAETFHYSKDSTYKPSEVKQMGGLEWVELVEETPDKLVLQHLLVAGKPGEQFVIKHWRQDWLYENTDFYSFHGDNHWKFVQLPKDKVLGQWTQKVYQVDDSPRYEGTATWIHVDGKSFWENATDAPLPRREYTARHDYNVMHRRNRHEITDAGWVHDQDNDKIIRSAENTDVLLAKEKGVNTYNRVDNSKCEKAQVWWNENKAMWQTVREVWQSVFERNIDLTMTSKVEDKLLYEQLFELDPAKTNKTEIKNIIENYIFLKQ